MDVVEDKKNKTKQSSRLGIGTLVRGLHCIKFAAIDQGDVRPRRSKPGTEIPEKPSRALLIHTTLTLLEITIAELRQHFPGA